MQKKRWDLIDFCVAFITEINEKKKTSQTLRRKQDSIINIIRKQQLRTNINKNQNNKVLKDLLFNFENSTKFKNDLFFFFFLKNN